MGNFDFWKKLNNNNLPWLKPGTHIDEQSVLKAKYDKNNNSVWDNNEIEALKKDIDKAQKSTFDAITIINEIKNSQKLQNTPSLNNREFYEMQLLSLSTPDKEREDFDKNVASDLLSKQSDAALEIFHNYKSGAISTGWNAIKELLGTNTCKSKTNRQLAYSKVTSMILDEAQPDGISQKKYMEDKIKFLEMLLDVDSLPEAEKRQIIQGILSLTPEGLDQLIKELVDAEEKQYVNKCDCIKREMIKASTQVQQSITRPGDRDLPSQVSTTYPPGSVGMILKSSDKIVSFESVFKHELGVPFSCDNIEKYQNKATEFQILAVAVDKIDQTKHQLEKETTIMETKIKYKDKGGTLTESDYIKFEQTVARTLTEVFGKKPEKISEFLNKIGLGNLKCDGVGFKPAADLNTLVKISKALQNEMDSIKDDILDGKSMEEHAEELSECYKAAFGENNPITAANKYVASQEDSVECTKNGVTIVGIGLVICGQGEALPLVGGGLCAFGDVAVDATEKTTKAGDLTEQDKEDLRNELKEALTSTAVGLVTGAAAGKTAESLAKIVSKCPKASAIISKYGTYGIDFVLSTVADLMISGEIDLENASLGEVMAYLVDQAGNGNKMGASLI